MNAWGGSIENVQLYPSWEWKEVHNCVLLWLRFWLLAWEEEFPDLLLRIRSLDTLNCCCQVDGLHVSAWSCLRLDQAIEGPSHFVIEVLAIGLITGRSCLPFKKSLWTLKVENCCKVYALCVAWWIKCMTSIGPGNRKISRPEKAPPRNFSRGNSCLSFSTVKILESLCDLGFGGWLSNRKPKTF